LHEENLRYFKIIQATSTFLVSFGKTQCSLLLGVLTFRWRINLKQE